MSGPWEQLNKALGLSDGPSDADLNEAVVEAGPPSHANCKTPGFDAVGMVGTDKFIALLQRTLTVLDRSQDVLRVWRTEGFNKNECAMLEATLKATERNLGNML